MRRSMTIAVAGVLIALLACATVLAGRNAIKGWHDIGLGEKGTVLIPDSWSGSNVKGEVTDFVSGDSKTRLTISLLPKKSGKDAVKAIENRCRELGLNPHVRKIEKEFLDDIDASAGVFASGFLPLPDGSAPAGSAGMDASGESDATLEKMLLLDDDGSSGAADGGEAVSGGSAKYVMVVVYGHNGRLIRLEASTTDLPVGARTLSVIQRNWSFR